MPFFYYTSGRLLLKTASMSWLTGREILKYQNYQKDQTRWIRTKILPFGSHCYFYFSWLWGMHILQWLSYDKLMKLDYARFFNIINIISEKNSFDNFHHIARLSPYCTSFTILHVLTFTILHVLRWLSQDKLMRDWLLLSKMIEIINFKRCCQDILENYNWILME